MATKFHCFSALPDGLRRLIWKFATEPTSPLQVLKGACGCGIIFIDYFVSTAKISISLKQPYPKLFSVNREARCETAEALETQWVTLKLGQSHATTIKLCINFKTDPIHISPWLTGAINYSLLRRLRMVLQQHQPDILARIFDDRAFQQITVQNYLESTITSTAHGEDLERIREGAEKEIALMTSESVNYGRWLFKEILEHLPPFQKVMDPEKRIPCVVVFADGHAYSSSSLNWRMVEL